MTIKPNTGAQRSSAAMTKSIECIWVELPGYIGTDDTG